MPPKRKTPTSSASPAPPRKRAATENGNDTRYNHSRIAEEAGIVQRQFYPPEMSNERCAQYDQGEIPRPIKVLEDAVEGTNEQRSAIKVGNAVVHWFKRDLRTTDNRGLKLASNKAKENNVPLYCVFLISPQDYQAHSTSPSRVDFELRSLEVLKEDLAELNIPLHIETVEKRKQVPRRLIELCKSIEAKHVFCNVEYEVDELRREELLTRTCLDEGISFNAVHDDVVVAPGRLATGQGRQFSVYSPWYRAWVSHIHQNPTLLDSWGEPSSNADSAQERFKDVFDATIPDAPHNKTLSDEKQKRFRSLWPAGEHEAQDRLEKFVKERISKYKDTRNLPALNSTSMLSLHFASGTLSSRQAVRAARDVNSSRKLDAGNAGIVCWISEVAWRDFYKHILAHWPYVCMNKAFKYEYTDIEWEYNDEHFKAWCEGRTGFPIVDAAMRQLQYTGYVHNRCRMIVASFLTKDLMLDWRMGEKYFMENLIDADFASNNGGWGFSASTGVDPQPYFRIFNPQLQSERYDEKGEYIRKWVPELEGVQGKAIHDPYGRGAAKQAEKAGYPKPIVDHKMARARALERFKRGLHRDTA